MTPSKNQGQCHCGQVHVQLDLPKPLSAYAPRKCDCDYCMARDAQYISDKQGSLTLQSEVAPLVEERFASEEATFLCCPSCGTLMAVTRVYDGALLGTVNAKTLTDFDQLPEAVTVSPKQLSPEAKVARWSEAWMPVVVLPS